jgi:hypothetical protein
MFVKRLTARRVSMRVVRSLLVASLVAFVAQPAAAAVITIDFEDLFENDEVATLYPGVTFSNALVLTAGSGLNDLEYPPASGTNAAVALDPNSVIELVFGTPIISFEALFTYNGALSVEAFTSGGTLVDSAASLHGSNIASGPNAPNETVGVSGGGITRVRLSAQGDFSLDDVTYETGTVVPEPTTLALLLAGALAAARRRA